MANKEEYIECLKKEMDRCELDYLKAKTVYERVSNGSEEQAVYIICEKQIDKYLLCFVDNAFYLKDENDNNKILVNYNGYLLYIRSEDVFFDEEKAYKEALKRIEDIYKKENNVIFKLRDHYLDIAKKYKKLKETSG